ncbi:phage excisionase [Buttiauxella gaviniae ATCC 51604]|uniref:Phage excisionase n=1 Tax=Buttiauxella gaviniae ATCC 51604 TaxID=1354253 RepID=A0A1B7HQJ4_9ENTR|nr:excisionase family protein [Buttiauxella gaviniae]OAT17913.1 phage excisionase [Buttiauxella gaviniae ATCC 51604]
MAQVVFNEEWVVEARLADRTGLSCGQIKSYRHKGWIEGIHFKRVTADGDATSAKGLLWYNFPRINLFIAEA